MRKLGLKRAQNESPIMLNIFPGLSRKDYEEMSRIFFERLNFAAVSVLERPMAQIYAANALTGVIVDINRVHTEVTPIYDGVPLHFARGTLPIGSDDCERYLAQVLRNNTAVMSSLSSTPPEQLQPVLLELAKQIWRAGLIKVGETLASPEDEGVTDIAAVLVAGKEKAVIESGMKKRANAKASAAELARAKEIEALDLVTLEFQGQELTIGKERHHFCDPLFNPALLQGIPEAVDPIVTLEKRIANTTIPAKLPSLSELVGHSIGLTEVDQRRYIYEHLFVTGDICSHVKGAPTSRVDIRNPTYIPVGLGLSLQAQLSPFILGNVDQQNEVQPRAIEVLKVPDYFAEYRDVGDGYAAFLGGSIVAKVRTGILL
jgi:actin-related protein 9